MYHIRYMYVFCWSLVAIWCLMVVVAVVDGMSCLLCAYICSLTAVSAVLAGACLRVSQHHSVSLLWFLLLILHFFVVRVEWWCFCVF